MTPTTTTDPVAGTTTTDPPTRNSAAGIEGLLLVQEDLPGWQVIRPMDVPGEETWTAVDCAPMDLAWSVTGEPGIRSRGSTDGVAFRNTVVELESSDDARAVLDAVDRVWTECNPLEASLGEFWTEPFDVPSAEHPTAGLVLGGETLAGWVLAYWQIDHVVVILEVEGDDLWANIDPLLQVAAARVDGDPDEIDVPVPELTATTNPGERPGGDPVETTVATLPELTLPPIDVPTTLDRPAEPAVFPPADDDWVDHPLAYLAPHPDDLGDGWEFEFGHINEAEPADPSDVIEGCDAPVPPTLDGFELDYAKDDSPVDSELEFIFGQGTPDEAQVMIDAIRAITECDLSDQGYVQNFSMADVSVEGADDYAAIGTTIDLGGQSGAVTIVVARIDGFSVGVFAAAEAPVTLDEVAIDAANLINEILAEV